LSNKISDDLDFAILMDSMTTGLNSEIWCKSKRQLNMTALTNENSLLPVACDPETIIFQFATMINSVIEPKPVLMPVNAIKARNVLMCG
jgi:hypothetical protein